MKGLPSTLHYAPTAMIGDSAAKRRPRHDDGMINKMDLNDQTDGGSESKNDPGAMEE